MTFQAGSSPLASRQNPVIYLVVLIAAVVAAVFLAVWAAMKIRKKHTESEEYREKEASRPTKLKDVKALARKYNMKEEFVPVLWYVCRTFKVPNIYYSIRKLNQFDQTFKDAYFALKNTGSEEKVNSLFRLKFYLDKIFAESIIYSSTRAVPAETELNLLLKKGTKVPCRLLENKENYLSVEIPQEFYESSSRPELMERIAFLFNSPSGMPHAFITRVLRYQDNGEEKTLIVSQSKEIITKAQRHFKRIETDEKCRFTAVSVKKDEKGNKAYVQGNKKYTGILKNISGGGCCIASSLPIKEGQLIGLEFDLYDGTIKTIGMIMKSRKTQNHGVYYLHMKYVSIDKSSQNKILAKVYGYD